MVTIPASVQTVLFDLDGVLAHYSRADRLAHLGADLNVPAARLHEILFEHGLEARYDQGAIDSDEYLRQLGTGVGREVAAATWVRARCHGMRVPQRTRLLLRHLATRYELAMLTNNGPMITAVVGQVLTEELPLFQGRIYCSALMRAVKPEPAVYQETLKALGRHPETVLFLDDLLENVDGASALGLHAWHVTNPERLPEQFNLSVSL